VVNILGHAVALNAAGKEGASQGFYLPLDRVERALRLLQQGMPITRGTMQTCFVHRPMNAVKKTAGLTAKMDAFVRKHDQHNHGQVLPISSPSSSPPLSRRRRLSFLLLIPPTPLLSTLQFIASRASP
jgi:S1-C subfamily serine protease